MPRPEVTKNFNTFVDSQRRKMGLTHREMMAKLGWSKQRYWYHQKSGCMFNLKEINKLAAIRKVAPSTITRDFVQFYFSAVVEELRAS